MSEIKYIGGENWNFSDKIYTKLTGKEVNSNYNPKISVILKEIHNFIPKKKVFGLFWSSPTFKITDCHYLLHVNDKEDLDFIITTSSGNTVEGMAWAVKNYLQSIEKSFRTVLLVPELSSFKVSKSAIEENDSVIYIVLKNSTLDSIREFAANLNERISRNCNAVCSVAALKTAAYAQMGLLLKENELLSDNTCFVQTVSGGVGPAGFIESAYQLKANPEVLIIQPKDGRSNPIVDALHYHSEGKDPFSIFKEQDYQTSSIETTLGSTRPLFAIEKFIDWRENGGKIQGISITKEELFQYNDKILDILLKAGIYPNREIGSKLFDIEKSGFIAFVGVLKALKKIESETIIINFTGRYLDPKTSIPAPAVPHIMYDPSNGIKPLLRKINII
jgi:hypothetical protein